MRRCFVLLLVLAMALTLTACSKSEAAQAVDDQIAAIGEVTLESESAIAAAEEAVEALAEEDRKQLDNEDDLKEARAAYETLGLEDQAAGVEEAIAAIGTVTVDSGEAVETARALYDASPAEVQALVENFSDLEAAEETLSGLKVEEAIRLIDAIGTVTTDSREAVEAAQTAYDALTQEDAAKVTNASTLEAAATQLKTLLEQQANSLLSTMRVETDAVRGMSFYYPQAFPYYTDYWGADVRCFALPYLGRSGDDVWLRLVCDYTADDWIFFKQITFAVDDERYYKTFNYFDVVRDNAYGDVWEYVDIEVGSSEEELLWAIANSTQTIVRFEGDDYYHDFTVSANDKQAIRDVLTVYDALK